MGNDGRIMGNHGRIMGNHGRTMGNNGERVIFTSAVFSEMSDNLDFRVHNGILYVRVSQAAAEVGRPVDDLWLCMNFMKECSACVYAQIQHSQARTVGSIRDKRVYKPQIRRVWDQLCSLRQKLQNFITDMGPITEAHLKKFPGKGAHQCCSKSQKMYKSSYLCTISPSV